MFSADPANYGAIGDGVNDDTAALSSAIAAVVAYGSGQVLCRPFSVYKITSEIVWNAIANVTFNGNGATIRPSSTMVTSGLNGNTFRLYGCNNCNIVNTVFDGNRRARGNSGDCHAIWVHGSSNVGILGNTFLNSVCDDVFIWTKDSNTDPTQSSYNVVVDGNFFSDSGRNAVSIVHGNRCQITDNYFQNIRAQAPYSGVDVESNLGDANGMSRDNVIYRNTFVNCGVGARVASAASPLRTTISWNTVSGCDRGIDAESLYNKITHNTVTGGGIFVENGDASEVSDNTVVNNLRTGSNGFALYADTTGVTGPTGHTLVNNTLTGVFSTQFSGGLTLDLGNKVS